MLTYLLIQLAFLAVYVRINGWPRPLWFGAIPLDDSAYEYDPESREVRLTERAKWDIIDAHDSARYHAAWVNATTEQRVSWALAQFGR